MGPKWWQHCSPPMAMHKAMGAKELWLGSSSCGSHSTVECRSWVRLQSQFVSSCWHILATSEQNGDHLDAFQWCSGSQAGRVSACADTKVEAGTALICHYSYIDASNPSRKDGGKAGSWSIDSNQAGWWRTGDSLPQRAKRRRCRLVTLRQPTVQSRKSSMERWRLVIETWRD